jgi:hypothetical protein
MGLEPRGNGFSRPVLKYIEGTTALEIHDERAVVLSFAPGPIINAHDLRDRALVEREAPHTPQQGIAAHRRALTGQVPSSGSAA